MRLYLDSCVLIDALVGAEGLRRHTLQQLEGDAAADWVISDLVRKEWLVGPLRMADQIRLLAFRSFFSDCSVVPPSSRSDGAGGGAAGLHPAADSRCDPFGCRGALGLRCTAHQ